MIDQNKRRNNSIAVFLLLSLFVHITFVITFLISKMQPVVHPSEQVEVQFMTPEELNEKQSGEKKAKRKEAVTDQVVEQDKKLNDDVDPNTRFLSAHNQRVIRETKAARSGKFTNTALGGQKDEGTPDGDKKSEVVDKKTVKNRERGELPGLKDLIPKYSLVPGPKAPNAEKTGDPSQSDDYLKDVNTGMQTLLSTREFVYYTYYARIKEAIRQHWEPGVREKVKIIYRQGRNIASAKDRVTQVMVTLNNKGELIRVEVLTASGVIDLDNAAIEAFRAAQPFPNPPKGMVESDGTIKIRWDFVLEANNESSTTLRLPNA